MPLTLQCCLCGNPVSRGESHSVDPCCILLIGHADRERRDQKEQQFWCHAECFRKALADKSIMYILERDFTTIGECGDEDPEVG
jgi:hypothetical protein